MKIPYYDATAIERSLSMSMAITAIEDALLGAVDPEDDSPRLFSEAPGGDFLLMPTQGSPYSGVKALTIAPGNPERGLEKIQGVYVLFDSNTLAPVALADGAALTAIRTPAVTLTAVKHLVRAGIASGVTLPATPHIVVFGAGRQAEGHVRAAAALYPDAIFTVIGRRITRVEKLVVRLRSEGIPIECGAIEQDVPKADIILCTTSSQSPLFDGWLPNDQAVIAAIGQHGLDAREVDATLVRRSDVVVEGRASSWRESGNLAAARPLSEWKALRPANLRELVRGDMVRTAGRPALYTGVGMSWEDLVIMSTLHPLKG